MVLPSEQKMVEGDDGDADVTSVVVAVVVGGRMRERADCTDRW